MRDHPVVWKYVPLGAAIAMLAGSSFSVYYDKTEQLTYAKHQLDDLSDAEGFLVVGARTQALEKGTYVFIDFENASPNRVIKIDLQKIEVAAGPTKAKKEGGNCCQPIAPSRQVSQPFLLEGLTSSEPPQKMNVIINGQYGFAGSESKFKICELLVCDLADGGPMRNLACSHRGCP